MKKIVLLAASFLAFSTVSAFAEGPYIAGDLGLAVFHDSDFKDSTGTATEGYDPGYGFDIAGGYAFNNNFRAEAEFGYRTADFENVNDASLRVLSYMANGYYDFSQSNLPVKPYIGVGAGMLNAKLKTPGGSESDTVFGYQAMLGAIYPINKNFSVNAGYRFQSAVEDFEQFNAKVSYMSSSLQVGARFNF